MVQAIEDRHMTGRCWELAMEGYFDLIKGFVVGFLEGKGMGGAALFAQEHHVKHDPEIKHIFCTLTGQEDRVRVLADESVCQLLQDALANVHDALPLKLLAARDVAGAQFGFIYEALAQELGDELKGLFTNLPEGVSIVGYEVEENVAPEGKGIEAHAPLREYGSKARGKITGAVKGVIEFHDKLEEHPLVALEGILLEFR